MFERETLGEITQLRMCHGRANALDLEFLQELSRTFEDLAASQTRAVVLTGTGSIFSAGVDLKRLVSDGEQYIQEFVPALIDAFSKLFFFQLPPLTSVHLTTKYLTRRSCLGSRVISTTRSRRF